MGFMDFPANKPSMFIHVWDIPPLMEPPNGTMGETTNSPAEDIPQVRLRRLESGSR